MPNPIEEQDPWLQDDDGFGQVDFRRNTADLLTDDDIIPVNDVLSPDLITNTPVDPEEPATVVLVVDPPPPAEDQPVVFNGPDGSTSTLEKSSKGWKGSVDLNNGTQPQVYYGKTKDELIGSILNAQANATKKIREQNRQIKLGDPGTEPVRTVSRAESISARQLTADDNAEIKLIFEADPNKALETWFTKRTGKTLDEVVSKVDRGYKASTDLDMEGEAKKFLAANPTYYADPNWDNYRAILGFITKNKLGRVMTKANQEDLTGQLVEAGFFTATNLEEAFLELSEAGLLLEAPRTPKQTPAPPATPEVAPAAAQSPERIVRTETRPRAGLGIRSSEVSPIRPVSPDQPLSVEDFNNLSDAEIAKLYQQSRALEIKNRRR